MLWYLILACSDIKKEGANGEGEYADAAPEVAMTVPENGYLDVGLELFGSVSDDVDDVDELLIVWTSDVDGELTGTEPDADGNIACTGTLSVGRHTITLNVEDSAGNVSEAVGEINVIPQNTAPSCSIDTPPEFWLEDEVVILQGEASDPNVSTDQLTIDWVSNIDGSLGSGEIDDAGVLTVQTDSLSWNEHEVTLVVRDEVGATCEQTVSVRIGHVPNIDYCQEVLNWSDEWQQFEEEVVVLTNEIRQQGTTCGGEYYPPVAPVVMQRNLRCSSRVHSKDMLDRDYFAHENLDGESPGDRITQAAYSWMSYGENIAYGYPTPQAVVDAWHNSPGHCSNMMAGMFDELGVGIYSSGDTAFYWTQNFGSR